MFSTQSENCIPIFLTLYLFAVELEGLKIYILGKGLIAAFQLSSAASLNLGQSQNGVLGNGLRRQKNVWYGSMTSHLDA